MRTLAPPPTPRPQPEGRIWGAIVDRVLRRPALSAAVAAGLLLALAAPALQLRLAPQGVESFPKSLEVIRVYTRMQQAFPGSALPADIVIKAPNVRTPAMQRAIAQLERWALASGRAFEPITVDINNNGTVAKVTVPIAGNGTDAALNAAFHLLRDTIVPETVQAVPDTEAGVTGLTAAWKDQAAALKANLLPVLAFVLVLAFALMLLAFRSIVVAAKAIVLNLLSVGAAYGAAILIDATIVRAVLLPATMKLLGDWNWYLPPWLQWLPRLEHEEPPPATPVPTA